MGKKFKLRIHHLVFITLILASGIYLAFQPAIVTNLPFISKNNREQIPVDQIDFSVLEETADINKSNSRNWWLNSGGIVYHQNEIVKTIHGNLDPKVKWYKAYLKSNPTDTDGGLHPQNIFRLVNKNNLQNISQQAYFKINKTVLSKSPNRNESNGILFFNRYIDGDNLYYAGVRVDGTSIIKKKKNGIYYTLDQQKVFEGNFDKDNQANLLPEGRWIGIKSEVKNLNYKDVSIKVFIDREENGNWELIAEALDNGESFAGSSFINPGHPGIRTDFLDLEFKDYRIDQL